MKYSLRAEDLEDPFTLSNVNLSCVAMSLSDSSVARAWLGLAEPHELSQKKPSEAVLTAHVTLVA